ncbi:hypothetical protein [Apibacter sp. HY039]|uniref:hypothetical protein n=1 Tax=Apibacter sp. HY039 TaxID=2501476 RepID=UPI000FEBD5AC|nr:hypothetical protein [Apibacter sp. HY039]
MNKDSFYTENSGYDYIRFPLLKPYEVRSNDKGKEWFILGIPEKRVQDTNEVYGIKKINIINNVIICYCEGMKKIGRKERPVAIIKGKEYSEAWFILIPELKTDKGFTTEQEFRAYLQTQGIHKEQIEWKTPKELYEQFSKIHCLPWIPNCN